MLVPADLADDIRSTMGFPTPVSAQLTGWATGIISELTGNAKVNNAPGTITGSTSPGSPLSAGAGTGGLISAMSSAHMATNVAADSGYPFVSSELSKFCTEIVNHIQTFGLVTFAPGNVTGNCTNTPVSPGPLVAGAGTNGTISGLIGSTLASAIHASVGYPGSPSLRLNQFCTAITTYIMANAQVSYASGNVTGVCPANGGPLSAGAGANGTIM